MSSRHGTGDLNGISFSSNYIKPIKKNLSYLITIGGSTHQGKNELIYNLNGKDIDGSILYTTSGIQLGFGLDYNLIKIKKHKFNVRLIPFIRYQSTSIPDVSTILYPPITELPLPVIYFEQFRPSETIAAGLESNLIYNLTLFNTVSLNLIASFQFDTNGDTLRGLGIGLVKTFN
ncbi:MULTISPECIES: hypothetical protein [unclassified Polaribacter]|uniref:hypothetical protein n=1 Tax=unclassified Polaribacter TaxID=196858 RepID=UPI0011BF5C31|nr:MULTISPECIES: hypothetical protein [unclassified Polaribacter]TXD53501.1 hypothetical protein ES043_03710 [Polaribacter sp. IC063]TXD58351.1 hypothetical protein ES044_12490 [Polaribacter sp. IC066]